MKTRVTFHRDGSHWRRPTPRLGGGSAPEHAVLAGFVWLLVPAALAVMGVVLAAMPLLRRADRARGRR
jgi:hypothetical protein